MKERHIVEKKTLAQSLMSFIDCFVGATALIAATVFFIRYTATWQAVLWTVLLIVDVIDSIVRTIKEEKEKKDDATNNS